MQFDTNFKNVTFRNDLVGSVGFSFDSNSVNRDDSEFVNLISFHVLGERKLRGVGGVHYAFRFYVFSNARFLLGAVLDLVAVSRQIGKMNNKKVDTINF